jgi:V8-like Glu-specific endopeptidase
MKKTLLLLLLFVMGCASNSMPFNSNHNWARSHFTEHDGVVAVTIDKTRAHCSGVVLTPNLVMTAGHCVDTRLNGRLYVVHGCNNIRNEEECTYTRVAMAVPHPNHKENGPVWNDIAVIKPLKPITDVKPVTLAEGLKTNSTIHLAGFGKRVGEKGGILYAGTSKIDHFWLYGFQTLLNGENGPCAGDSGSPAFDSEGNVIGILSRSVRDSVTHCGGIAKYTMPAMYVDWLQQMSSILGKIKIKQEEVDPTCSVPKM